MLMVSVSVVEPPDAILAAPKVLLMLGGCTAGCTLVGALPVLPFRPWGDVNLPVTLLMAPAVVLVTSTAMAFFFNAAMPAQLWALALPPALPIELTVPPLQVLLKLGLAATLRL